MKFQIEVEIDDAVLDLIPIAVEDQGEWMTTTIARSVWQPWGGFCDIDAIKVREVGQCDHVMAHGPGHQSISPCKNVYVGHVEHYNNHACWTDGDERDTGWERHPMVFFW